MCIKGTTTTHLRSRWGRVETEEGWWRCRLKRHYVIRFVVVLLQDICSASGNGTVNQMRVQPTFLKKNKINRLGRAQTYVIRPTISPEG
jgi:hypothetical protein